MDNIKKNLANIVTLIGLIGAIGAGFVKYGQIEEKLANIAEPFDPSPLTKQIADNKSKIAVLEKTIQVLELTIKEFKMQNDNPLLK